MVDEPGPPRVMGRRRSRFVAGRPAAPAGPACPRPCRASKARRRRIRYRRHAAGAGTAPHLAGARRRRGGRARAGAGARAGRLHDAVPARRGAAPGRPRHRAAHRVGDVEPRARGGAAEASRPTRRPGSRTPRCCRTATLPDARVSILRAIELAPGRLDFRLRYADISILQGRIEEARKLLTAIAAVPFDASSAAAARTRLDAIAANAEPRFGLRPVRPGEQRDGRSVDRPGLRDGRRALRGRRRWSAADGDSAAPGRSRVDRVPRWPRPSAWPAAPGTRPTTSSSRGAPKRRPAPARRGRSSSPSNSCQRATSRSHRPCPAASRLLLSASVRLTHGLVRFVAVPA